MLQSPSSICHTNITASNHSMAVQNFQNLLALHCLKAPLDPNPISEIDKIVNDLRLQYRTFCVEFHAHEGVVMLPRIFSSDFGEQVGSFARLVDPNNNQFEVQVEKINGCLFLTTGFKALRDFYDLIWGGSVVMVFTGLGQFGINVVNRVGRIVDPPIFLPPMLFEIEKSLGPQFVFQSVPISAEILSFQHDENHFQLTYEKELTRKDVNSGFLKLFYQGFCQYVLGKKNTSVVLIDDCGNKWNCITIYGTRPYNHIKIGGGWKRMVQARRISVGTKIKLGAPYAGNKDKIYLIVERPDVI